MEELKLLIEMVANLPSMVLWVLVGFWAYKVIIIGSVYGVIRFCVTKFVEWKTAPATYNFNGIFISEDVAREVAFILRSGCRSNYFHSSDAKWLEQAVAEKQQRERDAQ